MTSGSSAAWAVLLGGAALLASPAQTPTLAEAEQLIVQGRLQAAESALRAMVQTQPSPQADYLLGFTLVQSFRFEEAEQFLERAVAARPGEAGWLHALAKARLEQGRNRAAIEALDRALALESRSEFHFAKAMCALNSGQPDLAEKELEAALAQDPSDAEALFQKGRLLVNRGAYGEAVPVLQACLERAPDHLEARYLLGLSESRTGDLESAARHFRQVLERVPGHVGALNNLGRTLLRLGQTEEGKQRLEQFARASSLQDQIEFNEAGVRKNPANLEARLHLARLLLEVGRAADSTTHLLIARRMEPRRAETYRLLAEAFSRMGREKESAQARRLAEQLESGRR